MNGRVRPESVDTDLEASHNYGSDSWKTPRCSMGMKSMRWVDNHILKQLEHSYSIGQSKVATSWTTWFFMFLDHIKLFLYNLDLSSYWPRRATPGVTPASCCLTYVAIFSCCVAVVLEIREYLSTEGCALAVDNEISYVDITTYAPPIALTLARKIKSGSEVKWESIFNNFTDPEGGNRTLTVYSRRICHGRAKVCDSGGGKEGLAELPLIECSDRNLFEAFSHLGHGVDKVMCIDFDRVLAEHSGSDKATIGLLGANDQFVGPMLRGTYGSPDYRFLEIRLSGRWSQSADEAIHVNVYASLLATDPFTYLHESNGSPRDTDPSMVQDGNFELGARKWGRLLYVQLTPGIKYNEELYLEPFHFTYSERCTFGINSSCNVKSGSFVTGDFPPVVQLSNKVVQEDQMLSVYLRLRTAATIHHIVLLNKTILDAIAATGGAIGMIFVFFRIISRDLVNGPYHKWRRLRRRLQESFMSDREVQFQNRVHDVVDTMPLDEVLRFLLAQSYKHREALIKSGALSQCVKPSAKTPFTPVGLDPVDYIE